ncbi:hypothetical protein CP533_2400 [Ophiocordyceps camponoti-saundersi (nom. inval.)]|nr:hypothetical protein CP533_2400 [Ophiocordyceps camponoti-saundersi (nom. inval.)]
MTPGKDMRRPDLIVPYQEPPPSSGDKSDLSSTMATTMPMAAMFTRNKFVGWAAVVFSIQSWLGESEDAKKGNGTPGYFTVVMSSEYTYDASCITTPSAFDHLFSNCKETPMRTIMALLVTYLPLFMPPPPGPATSGTEAPAPEPPTH